MVIRRITCSALALGALLASPFAWAETTDSAGADPVIEKGALAGIGNPARAGKADDESVFFDEEVTDMQEYDRRAQLGLDKDPNVYGDAVKPQQDTTTGSNVMKGSESGNLNAQGDPGTNGAPSGGVTAHNSGSQTTDTDDKM